MSDLNEFVKRTVKNTSVYKYVNYLNNPTYTEPSQTNPTYDSINKPNKDFNLQKTDLNMQNKDIIEDHNSNVKKSIKTSEKKPLDYVHFIR